MLPADQRLRKNEDFRLVYKRGRENVHPLAVLYLFRRTGEAAAQIPGRRIGFVVSKKQGNAVVRNRIKRRLREATRLLLAELKTGPYDLVFVGRGRLKTATWPEIQEATRVLLKRAGVLEERAEGNSVGAPLAAPNTNVAPNTNAALNVNLAPNANPVLNTNVAPNT